MKAFTNRYELKYVLDWPTYFRIRNDIASLFKPDPVAGKSRKYKVISVYYDTPTLDFFWEKKDGEEQRIKIRLRTYLHHGSSLEGKKDIFLEIKKKKNQNIFKKRTPIEEKTLQAFLKPPFWGKSFIKELNNRTGDTILEEVDYLRSILRLKPTLVTTYTREPFIYAGNLPVRITFDSDVRYRSRDFSLTSQTMDKHILFPAHIIMEIKYTDYFPQWLVQLIQKYRCEVRTFSKYGVGMEHFLSEQRILMETAGEYDGMVH